MQRLDPLLDRPGGWFGGALWRLPIAAPVFVTAVYALRHGAYALLGLRSSHESWPSVFAYEMLKFSMFYLLFIAIFFGIRSHAAMNVQRLRAERERRLVQQAQLLQLAQQIEPHFLFNALNTIAATVHADPDLADTLLIRLSTLLRAATDLARQPVRPLGSISNRAIRVAWPPESTCHAAADRRRRSAGARATQTLAGGLRRCRAGRARQRTA